jgi:hypothetical protein
LGFAACWAPALPQATSRQVDFFASSERYQVLARFDLLAGSDGRSRQIEALRHRDLETYATLAASPGDAARLAGVLRAAAALQQPSGD